MKNIFKNIVFFLLSVETAILLTQKRLWDEKDLIGCVLYTLAIYGILITIDDKINVIKRKRNKTRDNETLFLENAIRKEIENEK